MTTPSSTPAETHPSDAVHRGVDRRTVLATGATAVGVAAATSGGRADAATGRRFFKHGVASGDPLPKSVIIWTRVTPNRFAQPGSGKGPEATVAWQVSQDRRFRSVVRSGSFTTRASRDHTVKVDVRRLRPDTEYFYRFRYRGVSSRTGRLRTAPARQSLPSNLRLGIVSCANLQAGHFSAYRHLAARDDLQAIVHLGDYLYEYAPGEYGYGQGDIDIRRHQPPREMVALSDYRQRHAQYKQDPDLQRLHARYAFIVTWDDHELTNDAHATGAENHQPDEGDYAARRARSQRAYDEWMPVRMNATARLGDGTRLYRRLRFGRLAELSMLDLRTYRSEQASLGSPAVSDPERTITGRAQMNWLKTSINRKRVQWKIIGNPVMISPVTFGALPKDLIGPVNDVVGLLPDDGQPYNVDQWDGYTDDRREVFDYIRDHQVKDVVFVTGDIHSGWACDLPYDNATYPAQGETAGVEFVCSSVTSNNLKDILGVPRRTGSVAVENTVKANNRHVKYLNFDDHGFSILDVTPKRAQMDWFIIGDRADRRSSLTHETSYATASGTSRVVRQNGPVR